MKDDVSPAQVEALLNQLEQRMQRLRALYEQYFMGIERVPPNGERREVVRMVLQLEQTHINNTALRFRQRSLTQRFNSYKTYWNRISKQIEEGTYKRDRQRADRNEARRAGEQADPDGAHIIDLELEEVESLQDFQRELEEMDRAGAFDKQAKLDQIRSQLNAESPAQPAAAAPAASSGSGSGSESQLDDERAAKLAKLKQRLKTNTNASPLPTGGANMDKVREMAAHRERLQQQNRGAAKPKVPARPPQDDQARAVFNQLVEAKRRCNEPTTNLSYDSVQKSMQKQREQLRSSRGARDVDFKVVIKDGKAFLKPVPK